MSFGSYNYAPTFKERRSFELRCHDVKQVRKAHPGKIPIVIERDPRERHLPMLDRAKFLVPDSVTVAELVQIVRRRLSLHPEQALFLLINEQSMVSNSVTVGEVFTHEQDKDGYLYVVYTSHLAFGS